MRIYIILLIILTILFSCKKNDKKIESDTRVFYNSSQFVMGADLSYLNQILEYGGLYNDSSIITDPYQVFKKYGANVARFRLWHNPTWTKEIYGSEGTQMYNDFEDVRLSIKRAKEAGMETCLDIHYSDTWADPGKQIIPKAWENLSLEILRDSIYNYTYKTLDKLGKENLMPEYVQVGNEINPGFVLPQGNRWDGNESNFVYLINAGIQAVRDVGMSNPINPKVILHVAQPEHVINWFEGLEGKGLLAFDILGFSYYYNWSSVHLNNISNYVSEFLQKYGKEVMIMETAYPWTTENADDYPNIIDVDKILIPDYPTTIEGQLNYLKKLNQEVIDGGGKGVFYWEPAWITSDLKTQWGDGSAWDCNTLFDFEGGVIEGINYMTWPYNF